MDNIRYLNGKQVQLLRTFVFGGVNYSEVMPSGEDESLVVATTELNDNVQEKKARKSKIVNVSMHETGVRTSDLQKTFDNAVEFNEKASEAIERLNLTIESEEDTVEYDTVDEFMEDIAVIVFATNVKTDEEISLGEISELATSEVVNSLALDPEAIQRCLDGEQKTHKGFTFDIK